MLQPFTLVFVELALKKYKKASSIEKLLQLIYSIIPENIVKMSSTSLIFLVTLTITCAVQGLNFGPESYYNENYESNRFERHHTDLPQRVDSIVHQWGEKNGRKVLEGTEGNLNFILFGHKFD